MEPAVEAPKRQQSNTEGKISQVTMSNRSLSFQEKERKQSLPALHAKSGVPTAGRQSSSLAKTFDHASQYVGNWTSEKRNLQHKLDTYRAHLEHASARILYLEGETGRMGSEREELEMDLRRLQKHVFQRFESPDWTPASNADIRHKLNQLDSEVKTWSKANSDPHFHPLNATQHPVLYSDLTNLLRGFAKFDEEVSLECVPADKAWVLVQAYIMHSIYFDVFDHPFFGVNAHEFHSLDPSNTNQDEASEHQLRRAEADAWEFGPSMQVFYHKLRACKCMHFLETTVLKRAGNIQEAVAWRVQALRQLHPPTQDGDTSQKAKEDMCTDTMRHREKAVRILTSRYLNSGISALIPNRDQDGVKDGLFNIVSAAADLSYSLWTQKIDLVPQSLEHIPKVFQHNHGLMSAHQLHSKHLDDDPAHLDDIPILLITHPALVRLGDEEGAIKGAKTVLKKAVCWMGQIPEGA
jgi:hypothetical protein